MNALARALPYKSQFRNCLIFPEMINYTQIYAQLNSHSQFVNALNDRCPLMMSRNNTSALSIAVGQLKVETISTTISHIADNKDKGWERQLEGLLPTLCQLPLVRLDEVLQNSMIPYTTIVP